MARVYFGNIVHCQSIQEFEVITNGFLAVDGAKIIAVGKQEQFKSVPDNGKYEVVKLTESQFLLPGFIDCHIHAPQTPNIGLGLDTDLLSWLNFYTFPLEAQYKNEDFAKHVYRMAVRDTINSGTTCACYFATIYNESNKILAEEIINQGQRAFVGKVSSNRLCPDYYIETDTETSVKDNIEFIEYLLTRNVDRVKPIITPRFAVTCDMELMKKLADLAKNYELNITSHISESLGEIEAIRELFPDNKHYSDVYDEANLLTDRCLMAHAVHLEDEELSVLCERGVSIAHCPLSNTNLGSGICDARRLIAAGIKVGLGTDISGGNRIGIYEVMRSSLDISHHLNILKKQCIKGTGGRVPDTAANEAYVPFNYKEMLFLATLGGAEALSIADKVGNFQAGKEFDALIIDTSIYPTNQYQLPLELTEHKSPEELLQEMVQKFVYVGDDRNITSVFVAGQQVKQSTGTA